VAAVGIVEWPVALVVGAVVMSRSGWFARTCAGISVGRLRLFGGHRASRGGVPTDLKGVVAGEG
jgi:hypothetical protein